MKLSENELMETILLSLNNLRCSGCGKSAAEFTKGDDALLGCLRFDTGDASVGLGEAVFYICPECEKEADHEEQD